MGLRTTHEYTQRQKREGVGGWVRGGGGGVVRNLDGYIVDIRGYRGYDTFGV